MNRRTVRKAEAINGQKYIYRKTNKQTETSKETNLKTNDRKVLSQESIPAHPVR